MSEPSLHDTTTPIDHVEEQKTLTQTPLRKYFETAVRFEASDLLMRGGQCPKLRLRGKLKNLDTPPIDEIDFEKWIEQGISPAQWQHYGQFGSLDIGVNLDTENRFRVNIFRTRSRSAIAARRVSSKILNFDQLYMPAVCRKVAELHQGLVLVCGITGSGKSTTLAAMVQHVNQTRPCHILTIEDPIEYLFKDDKAIISQREIGIDVPDFSIGLKAMVRENPDVVLIGEMRDKETFESALRASETGHLVFGTIHASSAFQVFGRIYDLFPPTEREAIRNLLAFQLQAIIYQKLLPSLLENVQRVPAAEVLLTSPPTRKFIMENRESELNDVIREHRDDGMQTFTDSLVKLVESNLVHPRVAQEAAFNPEELKMRLRGITS